jgi:uncharacterized protein (DUF1330 family)
MEPYFEHVEETMAPFGGRNVRLRLDPIAPLEGDWQPPFGFAMMEFPTMERARDWYRSPAYAPLRDPRMAGGRFSLILADGLPDGETLRSVVRGDREREREEERTGAS